ncbi:MAG: hypothetical protein DCO96_09190 [Fluviicola sp. XM-24bin1]|nr:MAG: hypothetical protein DCO96_09190 [Fluviicola sp. XM-24bin1]
MKLTQYKSFATVLLLFAAFAFTACNKQHLNKTTKSSVIFAASSNEVEIAGQPFVMDQITLNLADIQISGESIQAGDMSLTLADNASTDFLNPVAGKELEFPVGTYPEMNFNTAVISNGAPSVNIHGTYYRGNGDTYDVIIALNIDQDITSQLLDTDGSTTILLEENDSKSLSLKLDMEILFSDLIPGLWNAAAVTNNNGAQTIAVNELNNTNIYNAISGKIGESFVVGFQ